MTLRSVSKGFVCLLSVAGGLAACSAGIDGEPIATQSAALSSSGSFIVLYKASAVPGSAAADVAAAGGSFVSAYPEIGVVIATSTSTTFASKMAASALVKGVAITTGASSPSMPVRIPNRKLPPPPKPSGTGEPLASMQWDMAQINAPQARSVTQGSKSVVVGILDSGIDDQTVVDLQGQVDHARSATCIGGVANTDPTVWSNDVIGHGTHVAGIIGAKINGKGIAGIASGVTLAAVKLSEDGFIYPEAFICGVQWGASHGFDLINASLFTDPWYYTCPSDPNQAVILESEQRSVTYATAHGVTVIAAASNENQDLAHPTTDPFSPTNMETVPRTVTSACKLLPAQLPGVITVSAVGGDGNLAYYSNYGLGTVDLTAPGGDLHVSLPGDPSGQIVSTIPSYSFYYQEAIDWNGRVGIGCTDGLDPNDPASDPSTCAETYALLQGTSQSTPHVTGVAALVLSRYGKLGTAGLLARLSLTTISKSCPANPYQPYPDDMPAETCQGIAGYTGFYGAGEVNASAAVGGR
jgi:lantibiotic leader peptide-processing serine protease